MNTKNQQNHFKNPVVIILALALIGLCGYLLLNKGSNSQTKKDLVQLQDVCHNWAKTIEANNRFGDNASLQTFTHYNTSLGKCFVEIQSSRYSSDGSYILYDNVYDGEKGTEIFSKFTSPTVQNSLDYRPINGVTSATNSMTNEQFDSLQDQYMNN